MNTIEFLTSAKEVSDGVSEFVRQWNNSSIEIETMTSGSTGLPKKISLQKKNVLESAAATGHFFNFKAGETIFLCLPVHTIGGKMQLIRAMLWKMKLLVGPLSRNPIKELRQEVSFCSLSPIQLEKILEESPEKLSLVKTFLLGGAPISKALSEKINQKKLNVYEGFGMTETVSHIALRKISGNDPQTAPFNCLPGITVSQKNGKLVITATHLSIRNLETTDEVEVLSPTAFRWLGRSDFVINSGGYKFHPEILEQKISPYVDLPFFIIGEKDAEFQEIVSLFVESEYSEVLESNLKKILREHLSAYENPKKIHFTSPFSSTSSGKVNRIETQKKYFESQK